MARGVTWLVILAALVGPFLYWDGGVLEGEATPFLINYTDDRSFAARIFDPSRNDYDAYQARELSYAIDAIDAVIGVGLIRATGMPIFVPASAVIATALLLWVFVHGIRTTMPHVDRWTAIALTGCLVTSFPFVSTMGIWYRSAKPLLTVSLGLLLFHARRDGGPRPIVTALLIGVAGLLDRQGFFIGLAALVLAGVSSLLTGQRRDLVAAIAVTLALLVAYNVFIGPWLIETLNGYAPDFAYQARALRPSWMIEPLQRAVELDAIGVGELLGGSMVAGVGFSLALTIAAIRAAVWPKTTLVGVAVVAVSQVVMFALMVRQHPPIFNLDHRLWYYPLPFVGLLTFWIGMCIEAIVQRHGSVVRRAITVALALAVVGNLATLPGDRRLIVEGSYFARIHAESERLKQSIRSGQPDPAMPDDYRAVFDLVNRSR